MRDIYHIFVVEDIDERKYLLSISFIFDLFLRQSQVESLV